MKSAFYLLNADLDIFPRANDGSDWQFQFTGEPARADRPAHGFGTIAAKGRWKQAAGREGRLELDARLDRSEIGDMVALLHGRDAGVHGFVSGQVHLAGSPENAGIEGEVRLSELHGWNESPPPGGVFRFRVSGTAKAAAQTLELFAEPREEKSAIHAHIIADRFLQSPNWSLDVQSDALPIAGLPSLLRNFGAQIPEEAALSGLLGGELHYTTASGWRGLGTVSDAALTLRGLPTFRFDQASLQLDASDARLMPVNMTAGDSVVGTAGGRYSLEDGSYELDLASDGGPIGGLLKTFPIAPVPVLSNLTAANWKGDLRFLQPASSPGFWTGSGQITDATLRIPAVSQPLQILRAHVQIDGPAVELNRMSLAAGELEAEGDYRYAPLLSRPHQFRLSLASARASDLEGLFQPVLRHRPNLIDFALTMGKASVPEWLSAIHAEGTVQINTLHVATEDLERVRSRVQWDGTRIAVTDWQSRLGRATVTGDLDIDTRETRPLYTGTVKLANLQWQGGHVGGDVHLRTEGIGTEALQNLKVNATFQGRELVVEPLGTLEDLAGDARMAWSATGPRFTFPRLKVVSDGETWEGSGASQGDAGDVLVQLSSNGKQMNLAGSLTDPAQSWVAR